MIITVVAIAVFSLGLYADFYEKPYRVDTAERSDVSFFVEMGADIENIGKDWTKINATSDLANELMLYGYNLTELVDTNMINRNEAKSSLDWGSYRSYAQVTTHLADLEYDYPDLVDVFSIGLSVLGRQIWCIRITQNVGTEQFKPEISYISTMHGDEPVGTEFLLALADSLTMLYGTNPEITRLVDSVDIYLIPLMNPDGHSYARPRRGNANGIDLNRNFPVPDGSVGSDGTYDLEPETQAIMDFYETRFFSFTMNFHTGAVVCNYPWDYTEIRSPDDSLFIQRSLDYSSRNAPMYESDRFLQGITNGYDWYAVYGSMQDWTYWHRGDLHLTLEVSQQKTPPVSALAGLWEDNYEAIMYNISRALTGVRGIVTDSITGEPLGATVTLLDNGKRFYCNPAVGGYHRQLLEGSYTLRFTCAGYVPKEVSITVFEDASSRYDVSLVRAGSDTIYFSDFEDDDGSLTAVSASFYQDWEWGVPTSGPMSAYSGSKVWATRLAEDYRDSSQSRLVLDIDLTDATHPSLTFWHWYRFQAWNTSGWHDGGNIKWSSGTTTEILYPEAGYNGTMSIHNLFIPGEPSYVGSNGGWEKVRIDLFEYAGEVGQIYFDFGSSSINVESGWFIDDVLVEDLIPLHATEDEVAMHIRRGWNALTYPYGDTVSFGIDFLSHIDTSFFFDYETPARVYQNMRQSREGTGFFALSMIDTIYTVSGDIHTSHVDRTLFRGWNLIGGPSVNVSASGLFASYPDLIAPLYYYNPDSAAYFPADTIRPGIGYWLLSPIDSLEIRIW